MVFVAVNVGTDPVPVAASPIVGWLFVQVKVALAGVPVNVTAGTEDPEQ